MSQTQIPSEAMIDGGELGGDCGSSEYTCCLLGQQPLSSASFSLLGYQHAVVRSDFRGKSKSIFLFIVFDLKMLANKPNFKSMGQHC